MGARQRGGLLERAVLEGGEGGGQVLQRAADEANIIGAIEIGHQRRLCGLVLEIPSQMRPAQTTAKVLLLVTEVVLGDIVSAFDHRDDGARIVTKGRMTEQEMAVALEVGQDDGAR